jgi:hypothetical protein
MRTIFLAVVVLLAVAAPASAAPQVTITAHPASPTSVTTATFEFTVTEGGTTTCQLDSAAAAACTSPISYQSVADGGHAFTVRSGASEARAEWTVDTVAPDTSFTATPAAMSGGKAIETFGLASNETGTTFECSLNNAPLQKCTSPASAHPVRHGSNTFIARAVDAAGNVDNSVATYTWTADLQSPYPPNVTFALSRFPTPIVAVQRFASPFSVLSKPLIAAGPPTVALDPRFGLAWEAEKGAVTSFTTEVRREFRVQEVPSCTGIARCLLNLRPVYDDSAATKVVKKAPAGKATIPLAQGRSFCISYFSSDVWGNRSYTQPPFACLTQPTSISARRFRRSVPVVKDPAAWGGSRVHLTPGHGLIVSSLGALGTGKDTVATWIPSVAVVGRSCPDCGRVRITLLAVKLTCFTNGGCLFEDTAATSIKRTVSFRSTTVDDRAVRSVALPAGTWAVGLRIAATQGPVDLAGIAIPNEGGAWTPPADA